MTVSPASMEGMPRDLPPVPGGFLSGVNLPWLDYGGDFGANAWQPGGGLALPERRERLRPVLARLAAAGISCVRWFWLCDGRAGVRALGNEPLGLDECALRDLESSLDLLGEHGLRVMPVLLDFHWFRRRKTVGGVNLRGRGGMVADAAHRARLLERVFGPILERFGSSDAIVAWDLMNEPEWATRGAGARKGASSVDQATMRAFLGGLVDSAHRAARQPVTVGLASAKGLPLVRGLGLDFYQVHWYDSVGREQAPDRPVSRLGLDRPVLLGEFPTRGSAFTAFELLQAARQGGYAGAFAWSVLADDRASNGDAGVSAVAAHLRSAGPLSA
jgi:hypothetical protein